MDLKICKNCEGIMYNVFAANRKCYLCGAKNCLSSKTYDYKKYLSPKYHKYVEALLSDYGILFFDDYIDSISDCGLNFLPQRISDTQPASRNRRLKKGFGPNRISQHYNIHIGTKPLYIISREDIGTLLSEFADEDLTSICFHSSSPSVGNPGYSS